MKFNNKNALEENASQKQIFQHFCRISDCDIGHHSILHAIQVVDKSKPAKKSSEASVNTATADSMPMNKRLLDLQGQINTEPHVNLSMLDKLALEVSPS